MSYIIKASLHNHSYNSDGIHAPSFIVGYAAFNGIKVLSVTDHNEIRGSLKAAKLAEKVGIIFFPGIELLFMVKGRPYEILAYFYDEKTAKPFYAEYRYKNGFMPTAKSVQEIISLIRKHNGVVVAPHPFGRKGIYRKLRNRGLNVDGVEIINAFTGEKRNIKARRHDDKDNDFLKLGAPDMHFFLSDMKRVYTEISAKKEFTKEDLWKNLLGQEKTIKFKPKGEKFWPFKIASQKLLCGIVYAVNYPRLHALYWLEKRHHKKTKH